MLPRDAICFFFFFFSYQALMFIITIYGQHSNPLLFYAARGNRALWCRAELGWIKHAQKSRAPKPTIKYLKNDDDDDAKKTKKKYCLLHNNNNFALAQYDEHADLLAWLQVYNAPKQKQQNKCKTI